MRIADHDPHPVLGLVDVMLGSGQRLAVRHRLQWSNAVHRAGAQCSDTLAWRAQCRSGCRVVRYASVGRFRRNPRGRGTGDEGGQVRRNAVLRSDRGRHVGCQRRGCGDPRFRRPGCPGRWASSGTARRRRQRVPNADPRDGYAGHRWTRGACRRRLDGARSQRLRDGKRRQLWQHLRKLTNPLPISDRCPGAAKVPGQQSSRSDVSPGITLAGTQTRERFSVCACRPAKRGRGAHGGAVAGDGRPASRRVTSRSTGARRKHNCETNDGTRSPRFRGRVRGVRGTREVRRVMRSVCGRCLF